MSNARGMPGGGHVEASIDRYINFKKFQSGMEKLMRDLDCSSFVEVQLEI